MTILTRFPSRIRFVNPDGTLTPEAARLLDTIVGRVGGALGDVGADIFGLAPAGDSGAGPAADVVAPGMPAGYMAPVDLQPAGQAGFFETTFQGSTE